MNVARSGPLSGLTRSAARVGPVLIRVNGPLLFLEEHGRAVHPNQRGCARDGRRLVGRVGQMAAGYWQTTWKVARVASAA
jgi:hypothetical protein